jgi:hypothetical protein
MKAVYVDPFEKTVTAVDVANVEDYKAWRTKYLKCDLFELAHVLRDHLVFVDEEGLLKDWDTQAFWALPGLRPVAGYALIFGDPGNGAESDADPQLAKALAKVITWVDPKSVVVPAPTFSTLDKDGNVKETTLLGPSEFWTYDNQP